MFTTFGGRTITRSTRRPARVLTMPGAASARSRSSSSPIEGGTVSLSRTLPFTWMMQVTSSCTSSAGSAAGHPASATDGWLPSTSQLSSAVYGANSDSSTASVSAASRTAGSPAPGPESIARLVAVASSISLATATFSLVDSISLVTSSMVLCVTLRTSPSPLAGSATAVPDIRAPTSFAIRITRPRNFTEASGRTSAQSTSSSGGLANSIVSLIESTPCAASCSPRSTPLPSDLDIALPWLITCPWLTRARNGSTKSTMPMSHSTLMKNLLYSRCNIACSTPPTYRSIGHHRRTASTSNGPNSYCGEQYRRKYQDESTNVSIVSVSRRAGPAHLGHWVFTQSPAAASGEIPFGARSSPRRSGSSTGSWSSGTGTSPQPSQYTIGIGAPQNRCLETSQSRSR